MTNADKFKQLFGIYATELWAMPENDFLEWLNKDVSNRTTEQQKAQNERVNCENTKCDNCVNHHYCDYER